MQVCWNLGAEDWTLPADAAALQQSWAYGETVAAMGGRVERASLGQGCGLAQVIARRYGPLLTIGLLSRGPIWSRPVSPREARDALQTLRRTLPGRGLRVLLVTPEAEMPGLLPMHTGAYMAELPLAPAEEMRARMHGKWRNRLVKAERSGIVVQPCFDPNAIAELLEKDRELQRKKGFRNLPPKFLANWIRNDPSAFLMLQAYMGSEVVAEMLFLTHGPGATYQIGWSSGAGRVMSAHHLMIWEAACFFHEEGFTRLDLGMIDTVNAPGLARFKLGTGARVAPLGQTGLVLPGRLLPYPGLRGARQGTA